MSTNIGPHGIDLTAPGGIAALLDFHRRTFGDVRMEGEAGSDDAGKTDAAKSGKTEGQTTVAEGETFNFPDKTPIAEMNPEQRVEYWRHKARLHETREKETADRDTIAAELAALKASTQTDAEKAVEAAKTAAKAEGRRELLPELVQAEFRAAVSGRLTKEQIEVILAPLDPTKFLTADGGQVDTDKVQLYVDGIAPAGGKWPDMGQGKRGTSQTPAGVSAGRALHGDRHAAKK